MTHPAAPTHALVLDKEMPHPPEKIWRALTQASLMEAWLMSNDFRPVVGHKFTLRTKPMPNWNGVIDCEVLTIEPYTRLSYSWNALGLRSVVTWTLSPSDGGTRVRLQQSGFRSEEDGNYRGASYGWRKFIASLERVVAGLD